MLDPLLIPGLFITGTDTGVGKTMVAAAIANCLARAGHRVAVSKPIATGCVHRREGLVSEDAEFLAHHADARFPLDTICTQRYAEPLAPAIAAERAKQPIEWNAINRSIQIMAEASDVMIVEGVGGILVPLDRKTTVLDMAKWLTVPVVIVARPGLGTINHTLLTIAALRNAKVPVAGVVINGYPTETAPPAEETNPRAIEKWGKIPVLCLAPQFPGVPAPDLPADFLTVISAVDWFEKARES